MAAYDTPGPLPLSSAAWAPMWCVAATTTAFPGCSVDLLYLSTSLLWWQAVTGIIGGHIAHRAAQEFVVHVATQRARETSPTPPSAAHSARGAPAGASLQMSTAAPEALYRAGTTPQAGTPRWLHTGGETTPSLHIPRDARPARLSSFRLLAMASLQLTARQK
jgi:hypothetical protein